MTDLSPALLADLRFAVSRYGLTVEEVPVDHQGKTITDRLAMLLRDGESYCGGEFAKTDLRSENSCVWELFPENPHTTRVQDQIMQDVGELLERERTQHLPPRSCILPGSLMPEQAHLDTLRQLLAYIDGVGDAPVVDPRMWADVSLFDEAETIIPGLRAAEVAAITREQLVSELASGAVPAASAVYVRRALDSDDDGLRNADITLAGYRVSAGRLRDAALLAADALEPHVQIADQIRAARADLELIEGALHWPGPWQTTPMLRDLAQR